MLTGDKRNKLFGAHSVDMLIKLAQGCNIAVMGQRLELDGQCEC